MAVDTGTIRVTAHGQAEGQGFEHIEVENEAGYREWDEEAA